MNAAQTMSIHYLEVLFDPIEFSNYKDISLLWKDFHWTHL